MNEIIGGVLVFLAIQLILVTLIVVAKQSLLPEWRRIDPGQR